MKAEATLLLIFSGINSMVARNLAPGQLKTLCQRLFSRQLSVQCLCTAANKKFEQFPDVKLTHTLCFRVVFLPVCIQVDCKHVNIESETTRCLWYYQEVIYPSQGLTEIQSPLHCGCGDWQFQTSAFKVVQGEIQEASGQKFSADHRVKMCHCLDWLCGVWHLCISEARGCELPKASTNTGQMSVSADPFAG